MYVWAATFSTNMDVNGNSNELPSGKLTYGPWGIIREYFFGKSWSWGWMFNSCYPLVI